MRYYITPDDYIVAAKNGICERTLTSRVNNYGWSIERSIKEPIHNQIMKKVMNDEIRNTLIKNNISLNAFKKRMLKGWGLEKSINTIPRGIKI